MQLASISIKQDVGDPVPQTRIVKLSDVIYQLLLIALFA